MLLAILATLAVSAAEPVTPAAPVAPAFTSEEESLRVMNREIQRRIEEMLTQSLKGKVLHFEFALPASAPTPASAPAEAP